MARGWVAAVLPLLMAAAPFGGTTRADTASAEYPLKAAFLYQFLRFVEWPANRSLEVCVVGADPFGPALEQALSQSIGGRRPATRRLAANEVNAGCAIVFVGLGAMDDWPAVRGRLRGQPVLTVGESDGFTRGGGIVGFFAESNRLRFEVNRRAADEAGLKLSSRLLSLARLTPPSASGPAGQ